MTRQFSLAFVLGTLLCATLIVQTGVAALPDASPAALSLIQEKKKPAKPLTRVTAEDQKALTALFKDVDPSLYRLEFGGGKVTAGNKKAAMGEIEQIRKVVNPAESKGYIILTVQDDGVMFFLAVTSGRDLTATLGAQKAKQLNQIMAKYSRGGVVQ